MHSRTIIIATGAVALVLGLASTHSTVATMASVGTGLSDDGFVSAGSPITMSFSPEGFLTAKLGTGEAFGTDNDEGEGVERIVNPDGSVTIKSLSGDASVEANGSSLSISTNGETDVSLQRHTDTSSTSVNISVNGEELPQSDVPDNLMNTTIRTENTGTLDGERNENEVEIDRDIDVDVENDNDTDTDIDHDLEAGDNDIKGEEQEVGDIRPGKVQIDLRGLDD